MSETELGRLKDDWESLARKNAMWAVLTDGPDGSGGWTVEDFFANGRAEIDTLMTRVTTLAPDLATGSALDFGCGVGRLTQPLCDYFDRVVGVDIAPTMIEQAMLHNKHDERCEFIVNDRADLARFDDSSVDFISSLIVLQHIPKAGIRAYLREFARVLRAGGVAVFTLPSKPAHTLRGTAYRVVPSTAINAYARRRDGWLMQMNAIDSAEVLKLCSKGDLEPMSVEPSNSAGRHWVTFTYFMRKASH